jgi:hypothetical protein
VHFFPATLLTALLAASSPSAAGSSAPAPAPARAAAAPAATASGAASDYARRFVPDERMEFAIDYKGVRLGKAQLFVGAAEGSVLPVFLQTRTTGVASIITLRQQLASNLDRRTGLPRSTSLDAVEGGYRHSQRASFDRTANTATVTKQGKTEPRTWVVDVPPGTVDFLAMVFRLRLLPLEPGSRHEFDVLAGRNISHIVAEVVGREAISSSLGDLQTLKVRVPTSFEGEFQETKPTFVWFSDDDRRVVVRISAEFAIGRATATLVNYTRGETSRGEAGLATPMAR